MSRYSYRMEFIAQRAEDAGDENEEHVLVGGW